MRGTWGALLCGVVIAGPLTSAAAGSALPPGCDGRRAAVTHIGGGRAAPGSAPLSCATSTGYAIAESHLGVLPDGSVVLTPAVLPQGTAGTGETPVEVGSSQSNASPGAMVISHDQGAHWSVVKPSGTTWNPTDHGDYIDPVTGRLFFEDYGPIPTFVAFGADQEGPAHLNVSADGGKTWKHSVIRTVQLPENPQYTSAAPVPGGDQPVGYPRVTYFCANSSIGFTSPVIAERTCFRSLDGGGSFTQRSVILRGSVPVHPECNGQPENLSAADGHYPQPGRNGALFLMISCGPLTLLAKSTDEALTFPVLRKGEGPRTVPIPAAKTPDFNTSALQVLSDGTLVVVSHESDRLKLRLSGDEGTSWTRPVDITAPGLAQVATWAMTSRGTRVAVAYLGGRTGDPAFYGYLGLLPDPRDLLRGKGTRLDSGLVRTAPMLFGSNALGPSVSGAGTVHGPVGIEAPFPPPFTIQLFGNDFLGAAIGPDGTPWGSFTLDCGPAPSSPGCQANGGQTRGIVGRLVAQAAAPVRPAPVTRPSDGTGLPATGGLPLTGAAVALVLVGLLGLVVRRRVRT